MDLAMPDKQPGNPAPQPSKRSAWGAGSLLFLVEGVCAAVVGAFVATSSIEITLITAVVAVAVVGLVVFPAGH